MRWAEALPRQNKGGDSGGGLTGKVRERRGKIIVQFEYRYRSKDKIRQIVCGTWGVTSDSVKVSLGCGALRLLAASVFF